MIVTERTHPALYDVFGRVSADLGTPRWPLYTPRGPYDYAQLKIAETALSALSEEERETFAAGSADEQARLAQRSEGLALADDVVGYFAAEGAPGRER